MNRYKTALMGCVASVAAMAAQAQPVATTQASVGGATGDTTYSVRVIGADGVAYNCRPDTTTVDGTVARLCRRANAGGGGGGGNGALQGGTITAGGAAAIGVVAIALAAGGGDGTDSSTTATTTTSP
ncbi:hypothetical protein [uncultured Tateyamaria sp.]|uniref:hypothetical protein n=1 Tax=Tateyamaria sp. 1078 TaxID=3417464 RepID=UPI00262C2572|nr:hypothetical protein [uncultured Tateyamaria sp.]